MTELTINVKLLADDKLLNAIEGITSMLTGKAPSSQPIQAEAQKPAKQVKAAKAVVKEEAAVDAEAEEPTAETAKTVKADKALTVEEVRAKAMQVREVKGSDVIREALNELDAKSITALDPELYADFISKIEAA